MFFLKRRARCGTATTTTQSIPVKEKADEASIISISKYTGLSARDTVMLSAQSSHPAYTVDADNPEERQTDVGDMEGSCHSVCSKEITVLVICSQNGSVTLTNLDVSET